MQIGRAITGAAVVVLLASASTPAADTFLDSERYKGGEAIVGVLLTDDDYGRMIRDAESRETKLDWGWVFGQQGEQQGERKIKSPDFAVSDYRSIIVQPPVDHTRAPIEGLTGHVDEALKVSCMRLGWTPGEAGDLVLATAIVDVFDSDGYRFTNFFNATNKHSVEFEFRLTEAESGKILLLARHEGHSANLIGASWRAAAQLTKFLASPIAPRYQGRGKTISLDSHEMPQPEKKKKKKKPHKLEKYSNPREIVLEALRSSGLFEQVVEGSSETDYGLTIRVDDANFVGAYQTTVNVNSTYTLTDNETGRVLMEETIGTSATLSARDIMSGGKRMRQVTPAAFLDNADAFIFRLDAFLSGSD